MRIAILGAGMCGLAVAWHLRQSKEHEITIFSPGGIGKGASGVAAGLLHPYVGAHAKKNWRADEGLNSTKKLLRISENALGSPVASYSGFLRPAVSPAQVADFTFCSQNYPDVKWRNVEECINLPGYIPHPGIFIEQGIVVDCPKYLKGLWIACCANGVILEPVGVSSLRELDSMDLVIVTMGASTTSLPELSHLIIKPVKGQILEFRWPKDLPMLPYPLNSRAYLIMQPETNSCIVGSTFERTFTSSEPDPKTALNEILPKLHAFFQGISADDLIDCRAGIRAELPIRRPLIAKVNEKCWVLTGMGSKGLLYHALFAEELSKKIATS